MLVGEWRVSLLTLGRLEVEEQRAAPDTLGSVGEQQHCCQNILEMAACCPRPGADPESHSLELSGQLEKLEQLQFLANYY
jgi:hypothetical protein